MTIQQFNHLRMDAHLYGTCVSQQEASHGFSCELGETETIFEFEGFKVCYVGNDFLWMEEIATGKVIKEQDCTKNDLEEYSISELEQIINDANKIIKQRQNAEAQIAIDNFVKAWKELQKHEQVRMRVNGNKTHFHEHVNNVTIQIMPLN